MWNNGISKPLKNECQRLLHLDLPVDKWAQEEGIADAEILERIEKASNDMMADKQQRAGDTIWRNIQKSFVLQTLDQNWKEHLLALDHLRQGINLRAIAQRDPLNEYKAEAFALFEELLYKLREQTTQTLSMIEINNDPGVVDALEDQLREDHNVRRNEGRMDPALMGTPQNMPQNNVKPFPEKLAFDPNDQTTWGKVPRNAPCPCGSGKKFKHCHGRVT